MSYIIFMSHGSWSLCSCARNGCSLFCHPLSLYKGSLSWHKCTVTFYMTESEFHIVVIHLQMEKQIVTYISASLSIFNNLIHFSCFAFTLWFRLNFYTESVWSESPDHHWGVSHLRCQKNDYKYEVISWVHILHHPEDQCQSELRCQEYYQHIWTFLTNENILKKWCNL